MPCAMLLGQRIALRMRKRANESTAPGVSALDASVYGLFGLLLAFTFSGASSRFDQRREMVDITTTRLAATRFHPPEIIYAMILALGLACAFLAGSSMARGTDRHWPHILAFTLAVCATVYMITDIEFPRVGLIRVDSADLLLVELLESMK